MDTHTSVTEDSSSSTSVLRDRENYLDRALDSDQIQSTNTNPEVRQKEPDPRLTCSNLQAVRISCTYPKTDEKLKEEEGEEEASLAENRPSRAAQDRCQVTGCEVDISELKGYYRRHQICLRCAYANSVLVDGESKRYCQQCSK